MIDLLNITDKEALVTKWRHVIDAVGPINKWDTHAELAWIAEAASRIEGLGNYIELGSYWGASTKAVALANPRLRIYCLDTWDDANSYEIFLDTTKEFQHRIAALRGDSNDAAAIRLISPIQFDMAFIDGSHEYSQVKMDIANVKPLMKPGGLLCGHDFRQDKPDDGVTLSVTEQFPNFFVPVDSIWSYPIP